MCPVDQLQLLTPLAKLHLDGDMENGSIGCSNGKCGAGSGAEGEEEAELKRCPTYAENQKVRLQLGRGYLFHYAPPPPPLPWWLLFSRGTEG